jgi:hypothetical protein
MLLAGCTKQGKTKQEEDEVKLPSYFLSVVKSSIGSYLQQRGKWRK